MLWEMAKGQWPQRVTTREENASARPMAQPHERITLRCSSALEKAGRITGLPGTEMAKAKTALR